MLLKKPASTTVKKLIVLAGCLLTASFLVAIFATNHIKEPITNSGVVAQKPVIKKTVAVRPSAGLPVRLIISKLNVDTTIVPMGITKTGDMQAPNTVDVAGWYKDGPDPGNIGSSVIDGHVVGLHGEPGIFYNLKQLIAGDKIIVVDSKNDQFNFVVMSSQKLAPTDRPPNIFTSSDKLAHLNLITCTGDWDSNSRAYTQRLVVFANSDN